RRRGPPRAPPVLHRDRRAATPRETRRQCCPCCGPREAADVGASVAGRPDVWRSSRPAARATSACAESRRRVPSSPLPARSLARAAAYGRTDGIAGARAWMVLPAARPPPTEVDVELHQDPMDRLVQLIESQQLERRFDCGFPAPHPPLVRQKLPKPAERQLAESLAPA